MYKPLDSLVLHEPSQREKILPVCHHLAVKFDEEFPIQLDPEAMDDRFPQDESFHPIEIDKINGALEQSGELSFHGQEGHLIEGPLSRNGYIHIARGTEATRRRGAIDKDEPEGVPSGEIGPDNVEGLIGILSGHNSGV
jgi:hypothetical protein